MNYNNGFCIQNLKNQDLLYYDFDSKFKNVFKKSKRYSYQRSVILVLISNK